MARLPDGQFLHTSAAATNTLSARPSPNQLDRSPSSCRTRPRNQPFGQHFVISRDEVKPLKPRQFVQFMARDSQKAEAIQSKNAAKSATCVSSWRSSRSRQENRPGRPFTCRAESTLTSRSVVMAETHGRAALGTPQSRETSEAWTLPVARFEAEHDAGDAGQPFMTYFLHDAFSLSRHRSSQAIVRATSAANKLYVQP